MSIRSPERLIQLLESVNGEAFDNDHMPKPGKFMETLCRDAAATIRQFQKELEEKDEIESACD